MAKVEAELHRRSCTSCSMNPRMVEKLAAPVKALAERARSRGAEVARLEKRIGHGVDEMNGFARRLKKGGKRAASGRRAESGMKPERRSHEFHARAQGDQATRQDARGRASR